MEIPKLNLSKSNRYYEEIMKVYECMDTLTNLINYLMHSVYKYDDKIEPLESKEWRSDSELITYAHLLEVKAALGNVYWKIAKKDINEIGLI